MAVSKKKPPFALKGLTTNKRSVIIMATYRQNASYDFISKKPWNPATAEVIDDEGGTTNKNALPFGLCKKFGISLPDGARPRDAWEALKQHGVYPPWTDEGEDQYTEDGLKEGAEEPKKGEEAKEANSEKSQQTIEKMLSSDRMIYDKHLTKEFVMGSLQAATAEMRDATVRLFNEDSFGYNNAYTKDTAYFPGANKVAFGKERNIGGEKHDSPYEEGSVFFHESWHAIDANYGEPIDVSKMSGYQIRHSTLSETHILRNGKTFERVLFDECKKIDWGTAISEIKADKEVALKKLGLNYEDCKQAWTEMLNKEMELRRKAGYGSSPELRAFMRSKEYKKAEKEYDIVRGFPAEVKRKWGDLSDVAAGYTQGRQSIAGMGHSTRYFKQAGSRANEAFAECASALAVKGESYKVLKRFMPETMAAFEEIYQDLKQGVIKSNGRGKYKP